MFHDVPWISNWIALTCRYRLPTGILSLKRVHEPRQSPNILTCFFFFLIRDKICNFSRDLIKMEELLSLELVDEIVFLPWRIFLYLNRYAIVDIYVASIRLTFRWFERNYLERQTTVILFIDTNGNLGIGNCISIAANELLWQMKEK